MHKALASELIESEKTGMLVPPKDVSALINSIVELCQDEELRKSFGKNVRRKVEEELSWHSIVERTYDVYQNVVI